jgi:hypothetical protein
MWAILIAVAILTVGLPLVIVVPLPLARFRSPLVLRDFYPGTGILLTYIGGLGLVSALIAAFR